MKALLGAVLAVSCVLAWSGCCGAPEANGKKGVLSFAPEYGLVQGGLWYTVTLPEHLSEGGGKLDVCPRQSLDYDFEGTTVEAKPQGSATVKEITRNEYGGWAIAVQCPVSGAGGDVDVQVKGPDGDVRYEDTFGTHCENASSFAVARMGETKDRMYVGSPFALAFELRARSSSSPDGVTLGGHGMVGADDVLTVESDGWDHIVVHGNRPAMNPKIRAGDQEAEVPVEIVGPESVGSVDLVTDQTVTDQFRLNARLHTSSGELIGGGQCEWTVDGFGTSWKLSPQTSEQDTCRQYLQVSEGSSGQVCVTAAGHSSCATISR